MDMEMNTEVQSRKRRYDLISNDVINDRVILVDGVKYTVNSTHLSKESEFFNGLFNSNFMEKEQKEIELKEIAASDFKDFLRVLNDPNSEVTESTFAGCLPLSLRFLCPYVMDKCIGFLENIENFRKFKTRDIFDWSEGFDEIKTLIEAHLITTIENMDNIKVDQLKDCLEFSINPSVDKLNPVVRATMRTAVQMFSSHLLELFFDTEMAADKNVYGSLQRSIAELTVIDLFNQESNQNIEFGKYFRVSKSYKLEMLESVLIDFVKEKTVSGKGIRDIGAILEDGESETKQMVKDMISSILGKNFDIMNHDAPTLQILLNLAKAHDFVELEDKINTFLENDFVTNHHFKYIQLVVDNELDQLKYLMSCYLKTCNKFNLSEEHPFLFACSKIKDFTYRHMLNL